MPAPISLIQPPAGIESLNPASNLGSAKVAGTFQSVLSDAIGKLQGTEQANANTIDRFLSGENEEVHQVALSTQETELQFELFMQVRNKIVSAYQEVMKMQM